MAGARLRPPHRNGFPVFARHRALVIPQHLILPMSIANALINGLEDLARVDFARGDDPV